MSIDRYYLDLTRMMVREAVKKLEAAQSYLVQTGLGRCYFQRTERVVMTLNQFNKLLGAVMQDDAEGGEP